MNNWMPNNQQINNYPYNWVAQSRLPVYRADPIHGENAAWQFMMGPNSEIYLPDDTENIIWWIRTDQNGNRSVTPFDVSPHKKPEPIDINAILTRLDSLEEKVNAKFNKSNAKRANTTESTATNIIE